MVNTNQNTDFKIIFFMIGIGLISIISLDQNNEFLFAHLGIPILTLMATIHDVGYGLIDLLAHIKY